MKSYRIIPTLLAAALTFGMAASCSDQFEEVTDISLTRCLQPLNLSAKVSQGQNVTFGWDVSKDAESYLLEIYSDDAMTEPVFTEEIDPANVPVTKCLDVDMEYWFRVQSRNSRKDDSKWAVYAKSIKTFAVKSNLYMELAGRDANSISLAWTPDPEVDRIEYCVNGAEETQIYELSAEDIAAGKASITGLTPSTEYDLVLYFSSANRGEVVAWTMPDPTGLTVVTTSAALAQGISDGANMLLKMEGSPYTIGADLAKGLDASKGFKIYGEGSPDGAMPVIFGCLNITDSFDGGDIYIEGVVCNGSEQTCGFLIQHKEGSATDGIAVNSIVYKNCEICAYSKGLLYEWGKTLKIGELRFDSCYIHDVNADGTVGGDGIDLRQASEIAKLSIVNNTIANGFRTFLRIDANPVIGDVVFENNTLMNLSFVDNTNNGGIIAFQTTPASFSFKKNLFLNMPEKSTLTRENTKYKDGDNLNLAASDNWFWNCNETFFNSLFSIGQAGGKTLLADPCYNAKAGQFNILGNSEIAGAGIGASKWWVEYVEAPEDLTMTTIEGSHTWDFNDAKYFSSDFTKSKVRDGLLFGVSSNKITLSEGVLGFGAAAITTRKGVPTDGYLAFQVANPGSLIIKPVDEAAAGHHFIVGVGPLSGSSISIKGGASAMSDMGKAQKIVIKDITEESLVYIFPSGPISLAQLAWTTDLSDVNTALPTPQPEANPQTVTAGEPQDVVISWDPVEYAGSYSVVFNGKTYSADETAEGEQPRYTISQTTIGMLDPGSYKVSVYANPDKNDIYNTMSEAGVAAFAIQPAGGSAEEGGAFSVKSVDELLAAISAKKEAITLLAAGSPYVLSETLVIDYPLVLAGENSSVTVEGAISFPTGTADQNAVIEGDVTIRDLTFDDRTAAKGVFITLPDLFTMGKLTVDNVSLIGYSKSVLYGNFAGTSTGDILFRNITTSEWGTGQGVFDLRKGSYCCLKIVESTFRGGRDFIRMDAAVSCGDLMIRNNTFDGCNTIANGNGVLYVRASTASYNVFGNIFLNEVAEGKNVIFAKATGVKVPEMKNNFYYNIDEANFFSGVITREIATEGNGVVLSTDPVKDAANGDYTLVNGLAMSNRVGDPRWNPSYDQGSSASYTVKDTAEFTAAIAAGKTDITLEAGEYVFEKKIEAVKDLRLTGNGDVKVKGYVAIAGDELGKLVFDNIHFEYDGTNGNAFNVAAASSASSVTVKNCIFDGYAKSIWYDNAGLTTQSLLLSNNRVVNHGTGQGVIDIRKGSCTSLTIEQCTITGGRDLIRADANTITGAFTFRNNTVDGSNLGVNGNGIMYVRATPAAYIFNNNLFINEVAEGKSVILAKATGVSIPSEAKTNFFWNIDQVNFFAGIFTKEVAAGVELGSCPVKDAASGDYTLVDALAMSCNVGAMCWNPKGGIVTTDFTVNSTEELLNAIAVGKSAITLNSAVYDLTAVEANESVSTGVLTISAPLTLKGVSKNGVKPQIVGAIKLGEGVSSFVAQNIAFDGKEKAIGNAIELAGVLNASKIQLRACDLNAYSKSAFYHANSFNGCEIALLHVSGCTMSNFGTGQGMFDMRGGNYGSILIENSTICNGGRDFIRADAGTNAKSIAIRSNTFASTGIGAGNGLLWVRAAADSYIVADNLFINESAEDTATTKTLLAKTGASKATMQNNHFFNCDAANFWTGTYTQEEGTANGGSVLEADPCADAANGDYTLTNAALKAAGVGAAKWR